MRGADLFNARLPDELIIEIFRSLDGFKSSRDACSLVCRRWCRLDRASRRSLRIGASGEADRMLHLLVGRFTALRCIYIDERQPVSATRPPLKTPPVSSATATFAMTFSSSMSVVEYYLLKRFPVPYALYFAAVAAVAAFVGQHVVRRLIILMGRASLIIFILASTIFISAISLGGVGISNMIWKIKQHEYMGFENLCKYQV